MTVQDIARPRRRAFWSDARFLLGIVLVAASIAGVWFVVSSSRATVSVFAAARTIVPGQALTSDDLQVVDVALGQMGDVYLAPDALEGSLVATRTIPSGELVPQSAVGDPSAATVTTIVLRSSVDVPASVDAGTVVEVWSAPLIESGTYDTPRILVVDATVISVSRDDSMIGGGSAALEVVIARADVAAVLEAMSDESALSVVPTTGGSK
ncbi:SAF domain-containing protein [Microbacterium sp. P01]|uniref:SAF domain-containing protein n=1 Tax=unclassified Microbacterium TaxID=2609290 RepID=UPI003672DB30